MRGSVRKRGARSWEIQLELERVAGKRKRRFVSFKGTYKDAQKELSRLLGAADAGVLSDPTNVDVSTYLQNYLDNATHLSPKTRERYVEHADRQIVPHLGGLKLSKLKPEHLEAWHAALLKTGLAARTVGNAHRLLRSILGRAVQNGTIARNVGAIRRPPAAETIELAIPRSRRNYSRP